MYIEKIALKNFKAINELEVEFFPGVNLIIGENGTWKTTVLEGISLALSGVFSQVEGVSAKNIPKENVRIEIIPIGDSSSTVKYNAPVSLSCLLNCGNDMEFEWTRTKKETSSRQTTIDNKDVCKWMNELTNDPDSLLPIFSFQSAARAWRVKKSDSETDLNKKLADRRVGYLGAFDSEMDIKYIQQWCMKQEVAAVNKGKPIREYELFKGIVSSFMDNMQEKEGMSKVYYSPQLSEIVYCDENDEMGISNLSAGYQSLLWMIMDIAYRVSILNPNLENVERLEGIILIDEVDMHLHPRWQWNVIKALQNTFRNVQFIMATHSPIVISSAKNANVISLENGTATDLSSAFGYSVDDVLQFRQGSMGRPGIVSELMESIITSLDEDRFVDAKKMLDSLKDILGEDNSEYKRMLGVVNDAEWVSGV